jgi:uncharacterized protein
MAKNTSGAVLGLITAAGLVTGAPVVSRAQENTPSDAVRQVEVERSKADDIRHLMEMTQAGQLSKQMMTQVFSVMKTTYPKVPSSFWDDFLELVDPDELIAMVVPVYDKFLTHQEIKDLIQFYETPTGRKLIAVMPQIMQGSMQAGQAWGADLVQRAKGRLKEKGYI